MTAFYAWANTGRKEGKSSKRQMPELRPEATEINVTTPTTAWEDTSSTM